MPKTRELQIQELEQKVRLLEKQKAFLEAQIDHSYQKTVLFDMMIDIAEKEFNIPIPITALQIHESIIQECRNIILILKNISISGLQTIMTVLHVSLPAFITNLISGTKSW